MPDSDRIEYALQATRVLWEPDRRIDTFGSTQFAFTILTEPMDGPGSVRIRDGRIEAGSPELLTPDALRQLQFDGFGPNAEAFANWWRQHGPDLAILRYGFHFRKTDINQHEVHEPIDDVRGRLISEARQRSDPMHALLEGVEDAWEVSLLRFSMEMIQKSQGINLFDFRRRGLL